MSNTYYVRIRGRVQGPFSSEKLKMLIRRGQVSRTHEVSGDSTSWSRAADFSELFEPPTVIPLAKPNETAPRPKILPTGETEIQTGTTSSPAPEDSWYYAVGKEETGPVTYASLQHLFRIGKLPPETEVWSTGMENWVSASTVAGLIPSDPQNLQRPASAANDSSAKSIDADKLLPLFRSMRGWTMMLAGVGLTFCLMQLLRGLVVIVANNGLLGLALVSGAFVQGAACVLLLQFSLRMGTYLTSKKPSHLVEAMRAMRTFWVYVGVLLSILLALLLFAISLLMAGVDLAMWNSV